MQKSNVGVKKKEKRREMNWHRRQLLNRFPHTTNLQQTTLKTYQNNIRNSPFKWNYNYWIELKTWWQKAKFVVLSNFFFCRHVFKKPSVCCRSVRKRLNHNFTSNSFFKHEGGPSVLIQFVFWRWSQFNELTC